MPSTKIKELKRQVSHVWGNPHHNDNYPWSDSRRCLHTGCRMMAAPGMQLGFAFCEFHMKKAQRVLGWSKDQFFEQDSEE